jgi:hypothetical protein
MFADVKGGAASAAGNEDRRGRRKYFTVAEPLICSSLRADFFEFRTDHEPAKYKGKRRRTKRRAETLGEGRGGAGVG